ncbi:MAG: hypothetical protein LC126_03945 [Bryobacterales bacterium]|nr:hypothetical protein [Bryobacterales bacterium]
MTEFTVHITADNAYAIYTGTGRMVDSYWGKQIKLTPMEVGKADHVEAPVTSPFSFLYIASWSDRAGNQGLRATVQCSNWNSGALSGDTDRWQVLPARSAFGNVLLEMEEPDKEPRPAAFSSRQGAELVTTFPVFDPVKLSGLLRNPKWERIAVDAGSEGFPGVAGVEGHWMWYNDGSQPSAFTPGHNHGEPLIFRALPDPRRGMPFHLDVKFKPDMPLPDMVNSDFLVLLDPMSYPESMENLGALEEFLKSCGTVTTEIHGDGGADRELSRRRALKIVNWLKSQGVDLPLSVEGRGVPERLQHGVEVIFW